MHSSEPTNRAINRAESCAFNGSCITGWLSGVRLILTCLVCFCVPSLSAAVELQADTEVATAGYYQLKWQNGDSNVRFEVQEGGNRAFEQARQLYQGQDRATVVTGRSDGTYYYRARVVDANGSTGHWSDTIKVQVDHHPLSRALGFFTVGAIVFLASLVAILLGNRRYHSKESE